MLEKQRIKKISSLLVKMKTELGGKSNPLTIK